MNVGTISMRYARALLLYATEQGAEDVIYKNMSQLVHTLDYVRELPVLLHAPVLTAEERVKIICEAVGGDEVFEQFARLVVKEGREEFLFFIAHSYMTLYRRAKGILSVAFTTAKPVSGNAVRLDKNVISRNDIISIARRSIKDKVLQFINNVVFVKHKSRYAKCKRWLR